MKTRAGVKGGIGMRGRTAVGSIAAVAAVGALTAGGAGTAAAAGSGGSSGSASLSGLSDSLTGSVGESLGENLGGSADLSVLDGLDIQVDAGSLGVLSTGSLGAEANAPGMETSFDDQGRLHVNLTRPSGSSVPCTVALVSVDNAIELAGDAGVGAILQAIISEDPGVTLLTNPSVLRPLEFRTRNAVEPGSYVLASFCTTFALPPISDVTARLMIVPGSGWGSVQQTIGLGSTAGSLGLGQLSGSASSDSGSGSASSGSASSGSGPGSASSDSGSGTGSAS